MTGGQSRDTEPTASLGRIQLGEEATSGEDGTGPARQRGYNVERERERERRERRTEETEETDRQKRKQEGEEKEEEEEEGIARERTG